MPKFITGLRWTAFLLLAALLLGGCGGRARSAAPASTATATAAPTPAGHDDQVPIVLRFFTTEADPQQIAVLQDLIAEYQIDHPDIDIDIVLASPTHRERRLLTALASGIDLGIFEIEPVLMTNWAEAGYLLPLDDVAAAIGVDDYTPGSLFVHNGHVYALPYSASIYGLWVRKDLFEAAGLPLPTTYEDVLAAAEALTAGDVYGIALPAGQNIATVNYFSTFLWQNGGDYFSCDGEVVFGRPEALEAVKRWADLARYAPPGFTTWGYREQIDAFIQGRVAMSLYGGRLGVNLAEEAPELADDVTVIFPPWGPKQATLGVWSRLAIAAGAEHQAEAKEFLGWLLSGDRLLRFDMTVPGHMIPPLRSVQEASLAYQSPYIEQHRDWIASFYKWAPYASHPAMNMGVIRDGRFAPSETPPPWAEAVFEPPGVIDAMLQEIALTDRDPEEAWREAVMKMEEAVREWKRQHPEWEPPQCEKIGEIGD